MRYLQILLLCLPCFGNILVGVDLLFQEGYDQTLLHKKNVALITNYTAIDHQYVPTFQRLLDYFAHHEGSLSALFSPEHGLYGDHYVDHPVSDSSIQGIPIYSLQTESHRPSLSLLNHVDILFFDMQDIGCRSYSYITTLFYCMEAAAQKKIPFVVLDRPNPMGGHAVDGPPLDLELRSFMGYIDIPYCHGMTVGELATFFNEEYAIHCNLTVIPMKGWKRSMTFAETDLLWIPTSPQIPEHDTPFYYATTGLIGHLSLTSIGIGYTLPFKLIGAPWINPELLAATLNQQKLPGVIFTPCRYKPFFGKFQREPCRGVKINITDPSRFLPCTTQFVIIGVLKSMYPDQFCEALDRFMQGPKYKITLFDKLYGQKESLKPLLEEKYFIWKYREVFAQTRNEFNKKRAPYLNKNYGS